MPCAAIMTADPKTVRDSDSVASAARVLIGGRLAGVPVVDAEGRFVAMFTSTNLMGLVVPRVALAGNLAANVRFVEDSAKPLTARFQAMQDQPVGEIADRHALVLSPDTPEAEAFRIFCHNPAPLPVVDPGSGKLVGTVSFWDVMREVTASA